MEGSGYKELNVTLEYLEKLANQEPEVLTKKMYQAFSKFSELIIEAKKVNFKRGWLSMMKDRYDHPLFDSKEKQVLEEVIQIMQYFFNKFKTLIKTNKHDGLTNNIFTEIQQHYSEVHMQLNDLSREIGIFRFVYEKNCNFTEIFHVPLIEPPYYTVIKVPGKQKGISIFIHLIIESIRSILAIKKSSEIRQSISIFLLSFIDILKGDWKQGLLGLAAFYKDTPLVAELIGKVLFILLELFTSELTGVMHQSNKTIFIAFCLWGFSILSPESENLLIRQYLDKIKNPDYDSHKDSDMFILTKNDIYKLNTIIKNPSELQNTPLYTIPVMHLILELMA
jgi:hypothetical protein